MFRVFQLADRYLAICKQESIPVAEVVMTKSSASASASPQIAEKDSEPSAELNESQSMESKETTEMNANASAAVEEKATTAVKEEQETETLQSEPKEVEKAGEVKTEEAIQPVESTIPEVVHTVDDIYDFDDISGKDADSRC